jgi:putative oxidoreductase
MKPDVNNTWMRAQIGEADFDALSPETTSGAKPKELDQGSHIQTASHVEQLALAMTRIMFAFLFACHGAQKLFGAFGGPIGLHDPWALTAGILEFGGGILIAMGLFTRSVAFLLCGEMAFAYFKTYNSGGVWPILNHGELTVLYCFFFLYLWMRGAGVLSIDGLRGKG